MNKTPKKNPLPQDNPEQSKRFEETARQLEADESGKKFAEVIKTVASQKNLTTSRQPD